MKIRIVQGGIMTMVEESRRHLNKNICAVLARVPQTAVDRMIFVNLKDETSRGHGSRG